MAKKILQIIALILIGLNAIWLSKESCLREFSLEESRHRRTFQHENKLIPLTIWMGNRLSSRIAGEMTRILLEDALGYDNVVLVPDPLPEPLTVERLRNVNCHNISTECIPTAIIYPEVWAPFDWQPSQNPSAYEPLIDIGSLSNSGRYDWYISTAFVREVWKINNVPADHWRGLQVPDVLRQLVNAAELITIREMCGDCVVRVFYPKRCDTAAGGEANLCALLLARDQGECSTDLKSQIISFNLMVAVAWIRTSPDVLVMTYESRDKPLLFAAFDPESLTTSGKFTKIDFPDCNTQQRSLSYPSWKCSCSSNFELRKFVLNDLNSNYKDILGLMSHLRLQRKHLFEMMQRAALERTSTIPYKTVCNWLIQNNSTWLPWLPVTTAGKGNIYIGGMFPSMPGPEAVWSSPGDEIGALMAIESVNKETAVLKDYVLKLPIVPTQCRRELVLNAYISYLNRDPSRKVVGILGPACSGATIPMAAVSHIHNMIVMGYGADDVSLSDRARYPYYFRTAPSIDEFKIAYLALFDKFNWRRCVTLRDMRYPATTVVSRTEFLTNNGIYVLSREIPSERKLDGKAYIKSIKNSGITVIILNAYPPATRAIICEAYIQGLHPSKGYVWFLLAWLDHDWWDTDKYSSDTHASAEQHVPCSSAQMREFVDQGYFSLSGSFYGDDDDIIVGGGTVRQWKEEYTRRTVDKGVNPSEYATLAYDAVWTYAIALDKLLQNSSDALDSLFQDETSLLFREFIQHTDFLGVSGRVHFRNGDRLSTIIIQQNFAEKSTVIGRFVPTIGSNDTFRGNLRLDEPSIVWASGEVPSDSLPESQHRVTCAVESLRSALDVSCGVAGLVAAIIALVLISTVLCFVYWILKGRYSSKYRSIKTRLNQLGLLDAQSASVIFALDNWEISRDIIVLNRKLGQGAFGAVFGGEGFGIDSQAHSVSVAVKTLKTGATVQEKFEFLSEADTMKHFSHGNIVQLFGICTTIEPIYIVMELMIHGDLKSFLLARRRLIDQHCTPEAEEVTPRNLTKMALDIARGLQYLAQLKYVHRDLALRNCMVGLGNVIKIGDFGLARQLNIKDYYRFERKAALPIRWMAPEAISEGLFTTQSDVWSYGITLWELATFGGFPYQGVSNQDVLEYVKEGNTLRIPARSSEAMICLGQTNKMAEWLMKLSTQDVRGTMLSLKETGNNSVQDLKRWIETRGFSMGKQESTAFGDLYEILRTSLLRICWRFDYLDRPTPYRIVQILTENPELVRACVEVPSSTVTDDCVGKFNAPRSSAHARNRSRSTSVSSQMSERIRTSSLLKGSSVSSKQNIAISSLGIQSPGTKRKNSEVVERKTSFFFRL